MRRKNMSETTDTTINENSIIATPSVEPTSAPNVEHELDIPEAMNVSDEELSQLQTMAKELKLDSNGATKLLELSRHSQAEQVQKHNKLMDAWKNEILKDKDMGGASFNSTVSYAKAGLAKFDPENQLFNLLEQTGYGNNPHVIRFLAAIGRSHAEDKVVLGSPSKTESPRHERLYGKYNNL